MVDSPIGIFDSGLGGLTAFNELSKLLPFEDIVYFGDTGRVPYGNKSNQTVAKYAVQDIAFLKSLGIKMIVAACGTVSSILPKLSLDLKIPIIGVVTPTATAASKVTKNKKVGVIGTSSTIKSKCYTNELLKIQRSINVFEQDCPLFVPLVENGIVDPSDPIVQLTVKRYLQNLKKKDVDTLILGCTHYPLLKTAIANEMGENVQLINSGQQTALYAAQKLKTFNLMRKKFRSPTYKFYASDSIENFSQYASLFLDGQLISNAFQIDIEQY